MCEQGAERWERRAWSGERGAESVVRRAESGVAGGWNGMPVTVQNESKARYWPKVGEAEITLRWDKCRRKKL